jgi:3-oxoacyl-[acyl-carrier-protein] synthase III
MAMGIKSENMSKASILQVAGYLPERIVSNEEVESKIKSKHAGIETNGLLSRLFGSKTRRYACAAAQVSDHPVETRSVLPGNGYQKRL